MARINLLPWREAERRRRQRDFAIATGVALGAAAVLALVVHLQMESFIAGQQTRNQYLQSQITALEAQIKKIDQLEATKASLLSRMNIIQQLQESRPEVVHLFDELVRTIPEGTFLTKVDQDGRTIIVEGQAQSNARVSSFMRNIEASEWITSPALRLIENKDKTGAAMSRFSLQFNQRGTTPEGPGGNMGNGGNPKAGKAGRPGSTKTADKARKST